MTTTNLRTLVIHCNEQYPHFESERGQSDINAAIQENNELTTVLQEITQRYETLEKLYFEVAQIHETPETNGTIKRAKALLR